MKISINGDRGDSIRSIVPGSWYTAEDIETATFLCYTDQDDVILELKNRNLIVVQSIDLNMEES